MAYKVYERNQGLIFASNVVGTTHYPGFHIGGGQEDAFGRVRVSNAANLFDAQLTYDLQPLLFEQLTNGSGASIAHDSTERAALMTFSSTPTGGYAYMQSYDWSRYQPGNSHLVFVTFNFIEHTANVTKFAGYGDRQNNGVHFISNGTGFAWRILSDTTVGDQTILQANWNLDTLDGNGQSGITLDVSKTQIAVIDMQALYVGRVRVGFDIDGVIVWAHEFLHANSKADPYIQTASLPVICGMECTGTVSTTMNFICSSVKSEGGSDVNFGFDFGAEGSGTAASGARAHLMSIRPKTTFNSLANRTRFVLTDIGFLVTGANPVIFEICIGQATTTPSYADVNATYSAMEYDTAGTISGSPALVISAPEYVAASGAVKGSASLQLRMRYPITLDAAGAVRANGTLSVIGTGLGGASACRVALGWREER